MGNKLAKILDECIARISGGETVETCLARYARMRGQLEPLLNTALSISAAPKVVASDEFRRTSKGRLMARLHQEAVQAEAVKYPRSIPLLDEIDTAWQSLLRAFTPARKVAVPVVLSLLLMIGGSFGAYNFLSPSPALASQCTLSILSGGAEVQEAGSDIWKQGADGITLVAGTRIKTSPDSHALLTFFEGSTVKLEPNTDIEIQQVVHDGEQATTIILKQWMGKTWSRVVKMVDPGSHYQIETPSAMAIVRGTLFTTEVDETGFTQVATTRGLVSVVAQGEEVYLPASQQTQVDAGTAPSQPAAVTGDGAELIITVDMPAIASVTDPTGSSTGYLPSGLSFNQISGSQSSSLPEGSQVITIPQPVSGEYIVTLRYITEGEAFFSIHGESGGEAAFEYTGNYGAESESGWLIRINLQVDDGLIVGSEVSGVEPLGDEAPEKIVETEFTNEGAAPIEPTDQSGNEPPGQGIGQGQGDNNGQGQDENNGQGQDENNGQGQDENSGQGQDDNNGQGQENNQGQGQGQEKNQGQGQNENNGQGQGDNNGQGQENNQGQGQDENNGQGQDENNGQGQDENNGQGQGQENNQGQGQDENNGQGQDENNGQGQGQENNQGQGQDENNGQGQEKNNGQGAGKGKKDEG